MSITEPDLPDGDPTVIVYQLLLSEWDATNVPDHFEVPGWIHTGWYTGSPHPEISVVWDAEDPGTPTGYTGIDPSGSGPTARRTGSVDVDVLVPGDREDDDAVTGGMNPKKYAWQLRDEVDRIAGLYPNGPPGEDLEGLGVGETRRVPEPDDSDVEHHHRVSVVYTRYQGRE